VDSCWIWKGCTLKDGYGRVKFKGEYPITRVIWELLHGRIPDGMCVCHHCDNPPCVNPDHLFGTHKDNRDDMIKKGRQNSAGHGACGHKLSESDIMNIRILDIPRNRSPSFTKYIVQVFGGLRIIRLGSTSSE
jgi:hypothetical protein